MAIRYFCDLCKKELGRERFCAGPHIIGGNEYCKKCWKDEKNWPKIHSVEEK